MGNYNNEEEEEEEFYESLDRILSSSCSSTSASASDNDDDDPRRHHRRAARRYTFPPRPPPPPTLLLPSPDVWTSEPSSVAERRRRLLQLLGLSSDPALSRLSSIPRLHDDSPTDGGDGTDFSRSASCHGLFTGAAPSSGGGTAAMTRSRSDGAVDPGGSVSTNSKPNFQHQRSIHFPVSSKSTLVSRSRPLSAGLLDNADGDSGIGGHRRDDGQDFCNDPRCLIKDLDNGKEFVVKELREDGTWNKLSEVGTGRQLTMEEFELCVGRSPIVQELMRRQNGTETANTVDDSGGPRAVAGSAGGVRAKRRSSWLRSIKNVAGTVVAGGLNHYNHRDRKSSDEKDTSSEKGGRRSSSATDDSQDGGAHGLHHGPERVKVRQYGKSQKELTGLYMNQEIQAHNGSIWSIKFSLDGRYLASAGEDCVIHVWEVLEIDRKGDFLNEKDLGENGSTNPFAVAVNSYSPEQALALASAEGNHWEKKRRSKLPGSRRSASSEPLMVPEHLFALSEKPVCSFRGHLIDVLDLSWSRSQYLLSSSMDKTVRLWHMSSNSCLKTFSHSDYVTCIQFNPVDDRYFISGSLDEKVRIWSIPDRQIVDWNDLHEMVTAACYTPDGQGALVGSHKGSFHMYDTSENKLLQKSQVGLKNKKKKSKHKKITGFQFASGSSSKVLITSADSRIRVIDGDDLVHKFKGFRNTSSQISAYFTPKGKYVICASEDSHVYVWRYEDDSQPGRSKGAAIVTQAYEHFHCHGVTVAVPWPSTSMEEMVRSNSSKQTGFDGESQPNSPLLSETNGHQSCPSPAHQGIDYQLNGGVLSPSSSRFSDRVSATWPEELMTAKKRSPQTNADIFSGMAAPSRSAWGLVIVTAGRGGELRTFQNFGFPIRI